MKKILTGAICFGLFFLPLYAQTWSGLKRLTWNSEGSVNPKIAVDPANGIHIAWEDYATGQSEIFYRRSTDAGTTWSSRRQITLSSGSTTHPAIVADSGNKIHIAWSDTTPGNYDIYYKRSTDLGVTWLPPTRLSWNAYLSFRPSIAADSANKLYIVWDDSNSPSGREIFYKYSTDSGATWSARMRLTWNAGFSWAPSIVVDSCNRIHVVWHDDTPGNFEIYYKRSTDGGASWSVIKRMSWSAGKSQYPAITTGSGNGIHVMWHDDTTGKSEIYYKRSTDGGASWSGRKRLTWNLEWPENPSIATDSGNGIHLVCNAGPFVGSAYEIFHRESTDNGITWKASKRLTWNSGSSTQPKIALDSNNDIHVIWDDYTPGNWEIFYKNRK